jgi:hypothetical protein
MWSRLSAMIRYWEGRIFERKISRALALHLRGESRSDGLTLNRKHTRLMLEWRARDIHPWDRAVCPENRSALFVQQCFADTGAALSRLFEQLPQSDSIHVRVLHPHSDAVIMAGVVSRASLKTTRPLSDRIWLGQIGLCFRLSGDCFEPLRLESDRDLSAPLFADSR